MQVEKIMRHRKTLLNSENLSGICAQNQKQQFHGFIFLRKYWEPRS
jgi:hypothetical protein